MAISRDKKQTLVAEMREALKNSKMTVFAKYNGLSVADLQRLRRSAREQHVLIKVIKNRLVKVALEGVDTYKDTDSSALEGQLLYALSLEDEVAPAKVLAEFAKTNPDLQLMGAFSGEGANVDDTELKALANLPNKQQLVAEVVAQLLSPLNDSVNALGGDLHGLLDGIKAKATN
jgi:large subunit ribosomal protein L10